MGDTQSVEIEEAARHALNDHVHSAPTETMVAIIKAKFKTVLAKYKDEEQKGIIQKIYDALVKEGKQQYMAQIDFLSQMHELKGLCKKASTSMLATACRKYMMGVWKKHINEATASKINWLNTVEKFTKPLGLAAANNFKTAETNPKAGAWLTAEAHVISDLKRWIGHNFIKTSAYKDLDLARQSYQNKLSDFDEYYDSISDYQLNYQLDYGQGSQVGFTDAYNVYGDNKYVGYNNGHGHDHGNLVFADPALILLIIGLMFCLCFVFAALSGIISYVGCYLFAPSKHKLFTDDKNKNQYENV